MTNKINRALQSQGASDQVIYKKVREILSANQTLKPGVLGDVGCGRGGLIPFVEDLFEKYIGIDVLKHQGFPQNAEFKRVDLDQSRIDLPDQALDAVVSVETIEHLENPRQLMREIVRVLKPGGTLIVTTPNQQSLLSKATFLLKNKFNAFQEADYPAHITALLEIDLIRMARENHLADVAIHYSGKGRVILSSRHYPSFLSRILPRACSDNILLSARKP